MRIAFKTLLLAAAIGLGSAAHGAEPGASGNPSGMPRGAMMAGGSMAGGGMMGMGAMSCAGLSTDRLAALKGELALTPAQLPLWDAFADAAQAMGPGMGQDMGQGAGPGMGQGMAMHQGMGGMPMQPGAGMPQGMPMQRPGMAGMTGQAGSLPERLDRQEAMLTARLDAVRKLKSALTPLYAALTPDQKAKIDTPLCARQGG